MTTVLLVLSKLHATIVMPAGSTAVDTSADAVSYAVSPADGSYTVMVAQVTPAHAATFAAATKQLTTLTPGFKGFTRQQETTDGWILEFEAESLATKSPLYGVVVRRKVGSSALECARNERSAAARDVVAQACLSLAPQ